jgi:hypothetical protein
LVVTAGGTPASAATTTTCTWGGTAAAPTGIGQIRPRLTNTPSTGQLQFTATGPLAGGPGCSGKLSFTGVIDPGATCAFLSYHGKAQGLPGIVRFAGAGTALAPTVLYDRGGNVVGSSQLVVESLSGDSALTDCNTPEGFTHAHFSGAVEVFSGPR